MRNGLAVKVFIRRQPKLALPEDVVGLCIPCGIGDASWLYSKLAHLPAIIGREVWLSSPGALPRRTHQLIELLPNVDWAGYEPENGLLNEDVFRDTLPPDAGPEAFVPGRWLCLEANRWLEQGRPIADFLPWLPTDYHYPINLPEACSVQADRLLGDMPGRLVGAYISNRDKEKYPDWSLWSVDEWVTVLRGVGRLIGECGFVLIGAAYDQDKTFAVADALEQARQAVMPVIGYPLGTALLAMSRCVTMLSYPSGIGILANVLNVPGMMLLPRPLAGLASSYADPADLQEGRYRCFIAPETGEVLEWYGNGYGLRIPTLACQT